jgi:hypothetical protein
MDIEEVAEQDPQAILTMPIAIKQGMTSEKAA